MSEHSVKQPHAISKWSIMWILSFYLILLASLCFHIFLFHILIFVYTSTLFLLNGFSSYLLLKSNTFLFIGVHLLCALQCHLQNIIIFVFSDTCDLLISPSHSSPCAISWPLNNVPTFTKDSCILAHSLLWPLHLHGRGTQHPIFSALTPPFPQPPQSLASLS